MKPYYEADGITIYHGRCEDVLPAVTDGAIDLVFTSPPYNLGISSGGGLPTHGNRGKWKHAALASGYGTHTDDLPYPKYVRWQRSILRQLWRVISDTGAIYYNHKPRLWNKELQTPLTLNPKLPIRQLIVWARAGGINFSDTHYMPAHEWIVVYAKDGFKLRDKAASGVSDVWYAPQESKSPHPAPFPIQLPTRAIETTPAKLILDPFMGSGTTLRAAKNLGRRAIGIELEERWCDYAARRLSQEVMQFEVAV